MTFTESNTVEQMILDSVAPKRHGEPLNIREGSGAGLVVGLHQQGFGEGGNPDDNQKPGWTFFG
jgi:hypothetical protein